MWWKALTPAPLAPFYRFDFPTLSNLSPPKHQNLKASFQLYHLPSCRQQRRKLSTAEFWVNGEKMLVATVHLESRDNHPKREDQLRVAAAAFADVEGALELDPAAKAARDAAQVPVSTVLAGDFNFSDVNYHAGRDAVENDSLGTILPGHADLWRVLKGADDPGYTHGETYAAYYA